VVKRPIDAFRSPDAADVERFEAAVDERGLARCVERGANARSRLAALSALERLGLSGGPATIIGAAADQDHNVRATAVRLLGVYRIWAGSEVLMERLNDSITGVRLAAIAALKYIPHRDSLDPIRSLLADQNPYVRRCAASALTIIAEQLGPDQGTQRTAKRGPAYERVSVSTRHSA
jgi:HEAT repeat protein